MRILVMGAGALGSVFGGLLARSGQQVCLVGREEHMRAIREHGLTLSGLFGEACVRNLDTAVSPTACSSGPFDLILITTKSYDTAGAAESVRDLAGPDTLVVSLQNGLGNYEAIEAVFGLRRTLAGRVIFGAQVPKPGSVEVTVYAEPVMIGSPSNAAAYAKVRQIAAAIAAAGIPSEPTREVRKYIWGKLLYNCALNPLSAVLQVPYGGLLTHECSRAMMRRVVTEIFSVARAEGVEMLWNEPEEYVQVLFDRLIPDTAAHYASMLQDLKAGKRTEIDAMNGAIVRLGHAHGVETPMNETLTCLIDARESWIGSKQSSARPPKGTQPPSASLRPPGE